MQKFLQATCGSVTQHACTNFITVQLKEICTNVYSGSYTTKKAQEESTKPLIYPVYGTTGILRYCSSFQFSSPKILIGRVGKPGYIHQARGNFDVSDNALILDLDESKCNFYYLYYYLQTCSLEKLASGGAQKCLTATKVKNIRIKLPPLEVQQAIGNFLFQLEEIFAGKTFGIEKEIELRKNQFFAYSQKLLSLYPDGHLHKHNNPLLSVKRLPSVPLVAISTIAKVQRGNPRNTEEYIKKHSGIYPVYTGSINGASGFIDSFEYDGEYVTYINTSAGAGLVYYRNEKFNLNLAQTILIPLQPNIYDTKYLTYALRLVAKKYINPADGMQKLNPKSFGRIKIPLPPLEIQKEIGDFLYKIEQLIENEEFGLQKENQLRKTQLEYFINKFF